MRVHPASVLSLVFLLLAMPVFASDDECHMGFSAYAAAQPYIVNPAAADRAETRIVGILEDTSVDARGAVAWRIDIRSLTTGEVIATRRGAASLAPGVQTEVHATWDARDDAGQPVADGEYAIELSARHQRPRGIATESAGARSSEIRVVVDRAGCYDGIVTERERRKDRHARRFDRSRVPVSVLLRHDARAHELERRRHAHRRLPVGPLRLRRRRAAGGRVQLREDQRHRSTSWRSSSTTI